MRQGDLRRYEQSKTPPTQALDYGPCGSDYRHIENVSVVAKSAFHPYFNRARGCMINNWEIAPLIHIQSGAPFNVTAGSR